MKTRMVVSGQSAGRMVLAEYYGQFPSARERNWSLYGDASSSTMVPPEWMFVGAVAKVAVFPDSRNYCHLNRDRTSTLYAVNYMIICEPHSIFGTTSKIF